MKYDSICQCPSTNDWDTLGMEKMQLFVFSALVLGAYVDMCTHQRG